MKLVRRVNPLLSPAWQDHVNAIDYSVPLEEGREVTSTARYGGGYGKKDTWVTYAKQFADIVNG